MAFAARYDQYEDVGMAFTPEELDAFSVEGWANAELLERIRECRELQTHLMKKRPKKATWCQEVLDHWSNRISWFVRCAELDGLSEKEILGYDPKSKEGKRIKRTVVELDPDEWFDAMVARVNRELMWFVTIMRRKGRPPRREQKVANRIGNALEGDIRTLETYRLKKKSLKKKNKED